MSKPRLIKVPVHIINNEYFYKGSIEEVDTIIVRKKLFSIKEVVSNVPLRIIEDKDIIEDEVFYPNKHSEINQDEEDYDFVVKRSSINKGKQVTQKEIEDYMFNIENNMFFKLLNKKKNSKNKTNIYTHKN